MEQNQSHVSRRGPFEHRTLKINPFNNHLFLQPYNGGPLLLEEAAEFAIHLASHLSFLLERFQRVVVAIAAQVVGDRFVPEAKRATILVH